MLKKRYIGIRELSSYIGLTVGTIYVWICQKKIPYIKLGGKIVFDLKEIEKWLEDKRVLTTDTTDL